jgi:hypothetical protein
MTVAGYHPLIQVLKPIEKSMGIKDSDNDDMEMSF